MFIFGALTTIADGAPPPYKPNALCVALLDNSRSLEGGLYYSQKGGLDGSVVYVCNRRIRAYINYYVDRQEYSDRTFATQELKEYITDSWYGEIGVGYRIGRIDSTKKIIEIFGGFGKGKLYQKEYLPLWPDRPRMLQGDYKKLFAQLNIGYLNDVSEFGFGGRIVYLLYPKFNVVDYVNLGTIYEDEYPTEYQNVSFINIEPAVQAGIGPHWCRIFMQGGVSICLKPYSTSYDIAGITHPESFGVGGFFYRIGMLSTFDFFPRKAK